MKTKEFLLFLTLGAGIRLLLLSSEYSKLIQNRVEVSTPLNSYKRVKEGIYLYGNNVDPYSGDMVHETPLVLLALGWIFNFGSSMIPAFYVVIDLITAVLLWKMTQGFINDMLIQQNKFTKSYAEDSEEIQLQVEDIVDISKYVLLAYLFNPFAILNCVGLTTTVFSNLLLALCLYCLSRRLLLPCLLLLALESLRNMYPVVLLAPTILVFSRGSLKSAVKTTAVFVAMCCAVLCISYCLMGNWMFVDATLGFVFFFRELQPNIGLFWYFFMEMFEHFRTMFLITFQMNAVVLYLIPLTLRMRKDPLMLAIILISLTSIFRSYPCFGDVAFYLSLLPVWRRCSKFMAHTFIVFCFFLITVVTMPALWYLWIYAGSANANFYFGITLAFSTGEIFLVTDLLFAYVKREFCLKNGQKVYIKGKEAKIVLE